MTRGVALYLVGSVVVLGLAGCGRGWLSSEEREPWRREAELSCLKSGAVKQGAAITPIKSIEGPGICGADYPLKVAALGDASVLGYAGELRPPAAIPRGFPIPEPRVAQPMPARAYEPSAAADTPLSIRPPGTDPEEDDVIEPDADAGPYERPPAGPVPRDYGRGARSEPPAPPPYARRVEPYPLAPPPSASARPDLAAPASPRYDGAYPPAEPLRGGPDPGSASGAPPALGPPRGPMSLAAGPAVVVPAATLACPLVSALDRWMAESVQPSAQRWLGQPVVEIKQISAYSCRGMNGQRGAPISEHAFGNALDIAAFTLADGRKITVKDGWRGAPEEQGFLRDVHASACQQFSTVLAPGSNAFHYDHIHVDLARRRSGRAVCNPQAVPGDVVAQRARDRYGSGGGRLGFAAEDDRERVLDALLPRAIPGQD